VFLFMYSDCSNQLDPHTIITIFLMFWSYFMFFFTDEFVFSVFDSRYGHFYSFICFVFWITKGILRLHNRANILGMLLIILLSHVEIHICHL
jgi:hypothetical protein